MITPGFHHVALVARSQEIASVFYRDILGFALLENLASGPNIWFGTDDAAPGKLLKVVVRGDLAKGRWGIGGVHHVALGVDDETALLKWKRRLTDHGVPVSGPYDRGWFTSIYFSDADGQILEIATSGPGYDLDEPIDELGRIVALPKPHQMKGQRDEAAIAARTHAEPVPEITPDMRIDGIHHVTGLTNDVEAIGDFYQRALGLALVKRSVNQDDPATPHLFWANYDGTRVAKHSSLTMFGWPRSDYHARLGIGQTHHLSFQRGEASLGEWQKHLVGMGVDVAAGADGIRFVAPDGLLMEVT